MTYLDPGPVEHLVSRTVWHPPWIWPQGLDRKGRSIPQLSAGARGRALSKPIGIEYEQDESVVGSFNYLDEIVLWVFF